MKRRVRNPKRDSAPRPGRGAWRKQIDNKLKRINKKPRGR